MALRLDKNKIIIDSHADTVEECNTLTNLANALDASDSFKTVMYESGYAEFESVEWAEELKFILFDIEVDYTIDIGVSSVSIATNRANKTSALSGYFRVESQNIEEATITIKLKDGYTLKSILIDDIEQPLLNTFSISGGRLIIRTTEPSIPEGYRLLTEDDVGKTFGVDLEYTVAFDTNVIPTTSGTALTFTEGGVDIVYARRIRFDTGMSVADVWTVERGWTSSIASFGSDNTITYIPTGVWNDWLYVKDKQTDPADLEPFYKNVGGAWVKKTAYQVQNGAWVKVSTADGENGEAMATVTYVVEYPAEASVTNADTGEVIDNGEFVPIGTKITVGGSWYSMSVTAGMRLLVNGVIVEQTDERYERIDHQFAPVTIQEDTVLEVTVL